MLRARIRRAAVAAVAVASAVPAGVARAQLPGAPVLQNAFTNPGLTAAGNFAWNADGSAYAVAAAWAPGSARFQLSGGLGSYSPDLGATMFAYGARVSVPLSGFIGGGSFGLAPFAGIGRASKDTASLTHIPIGVGAGYRRAIGQSMGISAYATPFMLLVRSSGIAAGGDDSGSLFRTSLGLDFSFSPKIGVTVGTELGKSAKAGEPGPTSSIFGVGLSYAFR